MSFLKRSDAALLEWSQNFSTKIEQAPPSFFLTEAQALQIEIAATDFKNAYAVSQNPATRTKMSVALKDEKRAILREVCGAYGRMLEANPQITDQQRLDLRLTVRKPPTPITPPDVAPDLDILSVTGNTLDVRFHDGNVAKRAMPKNVVGVTVFYFIGTSAPTEPTAWTFYASVSKPRLSMSFDPSLPAGTKVFVTGFWRTARAESSPACEPVGVTLAGSSALPTSSLALKLAA